MPLTLTRERVEETVAQYVYPRAITFDEWLEIGNATRRRTRQRDAGGAADGTTGTRKT